MALYKQKGSKVWWYEFQFCGKTYRESSRNRSKQVATEALRTRRREVEDLNPARHILEWKTCWEAVRDRCGVHVRFHDLRHTAVTRMLEGGTPITTVAAIVGWSPSTMYLMAKRYGHIGDDAMRKTVAFLD